MWAGRRSGKTELGKRDGVLAGANQTEHADWWGVFAAPTRDQAKRIFWNDLKALIPSFLTEDIRESDLTVRIKNGSEYSVVGMDVPSRIEGRPLDWIQLDEYANMHPSAWIEHVGPALSTEGREGRAWFTGVPEGRNHFYKLALFAQDPKNSEEWGAYHWKSEEVLSPKEIASAKARMDPLTYEQEYEASFLNFEGRAYYPFERYTHVASGEIPYLKSQPLIFCFDFNVAPGVAIVVQEYGDKTLCIGEVWIPQNSNTPAVCRRLAKDWRTHEGDVYIYGDATGGAKGTGKVEGSDWDLVRQELRPVFGQRLKFRVPRANPRERVRVNAVNARLKSATGETRVLVDPSKCPHLIEDFEGVTLLSGGSGEIDKYDDPERTHLTDAFGYYIVAKFPIFRQDFTIDSIYS